MIKIISVNPRNEIIGSTNKLNDKKVSNKDSSTLNYRKIATMLLKLCIIKIRILFGIVSETLCNYSCMNPSSAFMFCNTKLNLNFIKNFLKGFIY